MLPQMGFEPMSPGLLVRCDDNYTTTITFQGSDGKAYNSIFMPYHLRIKLMIKQIFNINLRISYAGGSEYMKNPS